MSAVATDKAIASDTAAVVREGRPTSRPVRPAAAGRGQAAERHAGRTSSRAAGCPSARTVPPRPLGRQAAPREQAPAGTGTHLTARGRVVVVATLVLLLLAAFSLGRTVAEGSTAVQPQAQVEQTTVLPGETLWSVAQRLAPGQDPRPVVDQIRRLNDLTSGELQAGQQLLLPVAK